MVTQIQLGNIFTQNGKTVVTGGASGIDVEGLVDGLAETKRQPAVILESKIEANTTRSAAFSELKQLLSNFKDAANFLRNPPGVANEAENIFEYRSSEVKSSTAISGSNYLSITAQPGTAVSSYDVSVDQIASQNVKTTETFALADADTSVVGSGGPLNAGTLTLGPNDVDITLEDGDTLNEVIAKINAVKSTSNVEASSIKVSDGNYRLSFTTTETGSAMNYDLIKDGTNEHFKADEDGVITIEAEDFINSTSKPSPSDGSVTLDWGVVANDEASKDQAITVTNGGHSVTSDYATDSPSTDYNVKFDDTGTYYIWTKMSAKDGSSSNDSLAIGLDGTVVTTTTGGADSFIENSSSEPFVWANDVSGNASQAQFTVGSAGVHELNLFMREDGAVVDKFIITQDPNYDPDLSTSTPIVGNDNSSIFNIGFAILEDAKDAKVTVEGTQITRSENSFDDVFDGITFNLLQETPSGTELEIDINADTTLAKNGVVNFVDSYNEFRLFASGQTEVDDNGDPVETAILSSDATLRLTLNRIYEEMSAEVAGIAGDNFANLAELGITFDDFPGDDENPFTRNIMTLDEGILDSAIQTDFDAVRNVFEFSYTSDNNDFQVFSRTNGLAVTDFTINADITGETYQASYTLDGVATTVDLDVTTLSDGSFVFDGPTGSALEGMSMIYSSTDDATISVTLSQGISDRIFNTIDDLLEEDTGAIDVAISSLDDDNERYTDDIATIDEQIERFRQSLLERFSALEAAISQSNTLLESLAAQADARNQ